MALIFRTQEKTQEGIPPDTAQGFSWDAWYAKNKARLSEQKANRYRADPAYRAAALKRSREQREAKKKVVTDGYTVSFNDAAEILGVTVWVLREWRRKNYFPEPHRRNGRLWFRSSQVLGLRQLAHFFEQYGARLAEGHRQGLEDLTSLVYANW